MPEFPRILAEVLMTVETPRKHERLGEKFGGHRPGCRDAVQHWLRSVGGCPGTRTHHRVVPEYSLDRLSYRFYLVADLFPLAQPGTVVSADVTSLTLTILEHGTSFQL